MTNQVVDMGLLTQTAARTVPPSRWSKKPTLDVSKFSLRELENLGGEASHYSPD